ncbi:MAG: hypothetical protein ABH879_09260 [archaeon]
MSLISRERDGCAVSELALEKDLSKQWGGYVTFARNERCTSKILILEGELSVQSHSERDELWYIVEGNAMVYRGDVGRTPESTVARLEGQLVQPGDSVYIQKGTVHTAVNKTANPTVIAEVSFGMADEDDIVRYYDASGRVSLPGLPAGISVEEMIPLCRKAVGR